MVGLIEMKWSTNESSSLTQKCTSECLDIRNFEIFVGKVPEKLRKNP